MSDPYDIELSHTFSAPAARVWAALTDPGQFVRWYGPDGFPVDPVTVEIDARVGGRHRFVMVSEDDPSMRTGFDGSFTEVVPNNRLASSGTWHGIPGQDGGWASNLAVELSEEAGATHLVVREGPHPEGTAELGRASWEMMLPKLAALLDG